MNQILIKYGVFKLTNCFILIEPLSVFLIVFLKLIHIVQEKTCFIEEPTEPAVWVLLYKIRGYYLNNLFLTREIMYSFLFVILFNKFSIKTKKNDVNVNRRWYKSNLKCYN